MTTAAELASYASNFPSFRNRIINGNFDIWQRGTSQTSNGYGSADRWENQITGSSNTLSQQAFTVGQTEVPGNPKYYLRSVVTSVVGNGNGAVLSQKIEDVRTFAGKTATLSFWAKADSNKNIATEFAQDFGGGSSFNTSIGVTTHNLTTSWQKFTATVSIPSISGKTIGSAGTDNLTLFFWLEAGSDFDSRTNSLVQQSGTFDIAQVQVEEGTVPTPFEHRPYGLELSLCKRYCQVIQMIGLFMWPYSSDRAWLGLPLMEPLRDYSSIQISKTRRVARVTTYGVLDYWISGGNVYNTGDWLNDIYFGGYEPGYNNEVTHMGAYILKSGSGNFSDQEPVTISGVVNTSNNGFDSDGGFIIITSELT